MNFEEKKLHQVLIKLTKDFKWNDYFEYRKDRNWKKYDTLNPTEKLREIIREVQQYKNGYFEEENLYGEENIE